MPKGNKKQIRAPENNYKSALWNSNSQYVDPVESVAQEGCVVNESIEVAVKEIIPFFAVRPDIINLINACDTDDMTVVVSIPSAVNSCMDFSESIKGNSLKNNANL